MEFAFICRLLPYEGKQSQQHKNKCASEWLKQSVANETYTLEPESIQTHIAYTEREWVERARWHTGNGTGHAYYAISFHVFSLTERVYVFVYIIWVRILAPFAFGLCMCECVCVCSSDARAYEYQLFDYNVWVRRKECVCSCVCVCVSVGADRANNKHTAEQTTFHINRATTTSVAATNVFYFLLYHFKWSSTKSAHKQENSWNSLCVCKRFRFGLNWNSFATSSLLRSH